MIIAYTLTTRKLELSPASLKIGLGIIQWRKKIMYPMECMVQIKPQLFKEAQVIFEVNRNLNE